MTQAATVITTVSTILGIMAISAVALRLYCRYSQKLPLGADDYCMIITLILSTGISILVDYTAAVTGIGDPSYVPTMDSLIFAMKTDFALENAQIAAMGFVKVSILLFYKRIFTTRTFVIASNILLTLITTFTLAILLSVMFSKWPVPDQWNPEVPYNINPSAVLISQVSGNTMLDLLTLILPLVALHTLQMSTHRKLILSTIFSFGSPCIVASLARLYYAVAFTKVHQTPTSLFEPPFIYNMLWAVIELPVFIVAGCLLTMGPLFRGRSGPAILLRYLSSLWSLLSRQTGKSSSARSDENDSAAGSHHELQNEVAATKGFVVVKAEHV